MVRERRGAPGGSHAEHRLRDPERPCSGLPGSLRGSRGIMVFILGLAPAVGRTPTASPACALGRGASTGSAVPPRAVPAQVASAVDVDVVVGPRKDREEVEVLRGSLHRVVRVLQAAQLHLRLQETLSQKVTNAPMSFVKVCVTVTLCSATPGGTVDCCVCAVG